MEIANHPPHVEFPQPTDEVNDFLESEVHRITDLLAMHQPPISSERVRRLLPQLESLTTVIIREPEFTIRRNFSNGYELEWREEQLAA